MARIIEKPGTERIDTFCEHMTVQPFLADLYDYCPECGQKLHKEEPATYRVCSKCGKPVDSILGKPNYCTFCGEKFT